MNTIRLKDLTESIESMRVVESLLVSDVTPEKIGRASALLTIARIRLSVAVDMAGIALEVNHAAP